MTKGGKREGAGRPPLEEEEIKKNHSIKFTDKEWKTIQGKAKLQDKKLSASEYIRKKALED